MDVRDETRRASGEPQATRVLAVGCCDEAFAQLAALCSRAGLRRESVRPKYLLERAANFERARRRLSGSRCEFDVCVLGRAAGAEAARGAIGRLDATGTHVAVVSYLEASGSPSSLRYLVRRLRQRLPQARIVVGLWQADEATLKDERLRAAVGADHYITTVREAVTFCVAAAREQAQAIPTAPAAAAAA